mmetsp:Transcript_21149/g.44120  ORF Transcript_21149/g.44120 Transcript_21149/m.44120 type:complete len:224 (-) Transcript_21149:144-815(-)
MLLEVARKVLSKSVGALALSLIFFSPPALEVAAFVEVPVALPTPPPPTWRLVSSAESRLPLYLGGPLLDLRWRSLLELAPSSPLEGALPAGTNAEPASPLPLPTLLLPPPLLESFLSSPLPPGVGVLDFFRPPFLKLGEGVLLSLFPIPGEDLWVLGDLVLALELERDPWLSELNEGDGGLNPEDFASLWSPLTGWCDEDPCLSMAWEGGWLLTHSGPPPSSP